MKIQAELVQDFKKHNLKPISLNRCPRQSKSKEASGPKMQKIELLLFFIYISICMIYRGVVISICMLHKYSTAEILGSSECHQVGLPLFDDEGS